MIPLCCAVVDQVQTPSCACVMLLPPLVCESCEVLVVQAVLSSLRVCAGMCWLAGASWFGQPSVAWSIVVQCSCSRRAGRAAQRRYGAVWRSASKGGEWCRLWRCLLPQPHGRGLLEHVAAA